MVRPGIELRRLDSGAGPICRRILGQLPEWFGIREAVEHYVNVADRSPTVVASADGADIGLLTVVRHTPWAAEIEVMGVAPGYHRRGAGRQMLAHTETLLVQEDVEYLQVKTLAPSRPDAHYERTRAFYALRSQTCLRFRDEMEVVNHVSSQEEEQPAAAAGGVVCADQ